MTSRRALIVLVQLFHFSSFVFSCFPSARQCGCPVIKPIVTKSRIVGGFTAREHSWPWIVSFRQSIAQAPLTDPGGAFCGGTLINSRFVLTAAHCFFDIDPATLENYFVVVGAQYLNDTNPVRFKIKSLILHQEFDDDQYLNDIALIELSSPVDLTDSNVGFICLTSKNISTYPYEGLSAFVAGWGRLSENSSTSFTLQQVQLPIVSNSDPFCVKQISNTRIQFCAGFKEGGKDTCQGDSGGPLMIFDELTQTWQLVGITSYGFGCARANSPGVYTRVSMLLSWIDEQMNAPSHASIRRISTISILFVLFLTFPNDVFSSFH